MCLVSLSRFFVCVCFFPHCSISLRSSLRRQGVAGEKTVRYRDPEGDRKKENTFTVKPHNQETCRQRRYSTLRTAGVGHDEAEQGQKLQRFS